MSDAKRLTRAALRDQRRKLTPGQQRRAGESLARHLGRQLFFLRARHIAYYMPNDGEIDPLFLLELAAAAGKKAYLPVLDRRNAGSMAFVPWNPGEPMKANVYGIPEPRRRGTRPIPLWMLDVVCLPLVAFDRNGNRLGMGGGFYDRTFAAFNPGTRSKPLLVGLAHHFQQVENLPADPWDIPLHGVATDRGVTFMPRITP